MLTQADKKRYKQLGDIRLSNFMASRYMPPRVAVIASLTTFLYGGVPLIFVEAVASFYGASVSTGSIVLAGCAGVFVACIFVHAMGWMSWRCSVLRKLESVEPVSDERFQELLRHLRDHGFDRKAIQEWVAEEISRLDALTGGGKGGATRRRDCLSSLLSNRLKD